jgi:hypothetical protein
MALCPYCDQFQPTTGGCQVPGCHGFICGSCGRCNRSDWFDATAHAKAEERGARRMRSEPVTSSPTSERRR